MKLSQLTFLLAVFCLSLSLNSFAQKKKHHIEEKRKIDLIIQVNGELVKGEMPDLHLELGNNNSSKIETQYQPGHLILGAKDMMRLDTAKEFKLCFDNYTYKSGKLFITKFRVKIPRALLSQPYLIVSCYDFINKDYKRWYQSEANKEYAFDLNYPGATLLARNK